MAERAGGLSRRQQRALECFRQARQRGVVLSARARESGLGVREVYDAVAALRRKGVLPSVGRSAPAVAQRATAEGFVRVSVQPER